MLLNICFGFMVLIASLIELAIAKTWIWHNHNAQLANFELASLRLSGLLAPLLGYLNENSRGWHPYNFLTF